ncbi:MAG: hypothetical protein OXK76_16235 [Gammaproteobacteria bacterium]|nr:hypothetical protein [Gammaproteobacteria bacterium]
MAAPGALRAVKGDYPSAQRTLYGPLRVPTLPGGMVSGTSSIALSAMVRVFRASSAPRTPSLPRGERRIRLTGRQDAP